MSKDIPLTDAVKMKTIVMKRVVKTILGLEASWNKILQKKGSLESVLLSAYFHNIFSSISRLVKFTEYCSTRSGFLLLYSNEERKDLSS